MEDQGTPPTPSTPESVERAKANIERCLAAYDERGEAGLQEELDRMYPGTVADDGKPINMTLDPYPPGMEPASLSRSQETAASQNSNSAEALLQPPAPESASQPASTPDDGYPIKVDVDPYPPEYRPTVVKNSRTPAPPDCPHVTEGLTGDQPETASQDEEAAQTSAETSEQHGPWEGEVPGSRKQLGHGLYAFDLDGPVPMHVVAGPPMPTVKYRPGMEDELLRSSAENADHAPAVQEPAALNPPMASPEAKLPDTPAGVMKK
jgi:hypothetical protein